MYVTCAKQDKHKIRSRLWLGRSDISWRQQQRAIFQDSISHLSEAVQIFTMSSAESAKYGAGCTDQCKSDPCGCAGKCECKDDCKCQKCSDPCKCTAGSCKCGVGCQGPDSCRCDRKCACK